MSDYPMLISNKLHSFRNFMLQNYPIPGNFGGTIVSKRGKYRSLVPQKLRNHKKKPKIKPCYDGSE